MFFITYYLVLRMTVEVVKMLQHMCRKITYNL